MKERQEEEEEKIMIKSKDKFDDFDRKKVLNDRLLNLKKDVLVFNRVPKTGSEMFVRILFALSEKNNFTHKRYGAPQPRKISDHAQVKYEKSSLNWEVVYLCSKIYK